MTIRIRIPEFEEYIERCGMSSPRPWTEQEEEVVREYYGIVPTHMIAKHLDRTVKAVQDKAAAMGINAEENRRRRASLQV